MERLKNSDRYALPELASFQRKIEDDDFEIEMPTNAQTKAAAIEGKASKSWRALRIAGRSKLAAFDRIDDPDKIGDDEVTAGPDDMPEDKSLVVVISAATTDTDRSKPIVEGLMGKIPGVFKRVVRHAAREAREGESGGRDYTFVTAEAFSVMVGNDQFIEFGEVDGVGYGTSRRAVEAAAEKGKVPVLEVPLGIHDFVYGRIEEDVEVGDATSGNDDQPQVQQEPLEMAEDTPASADDAMAVDDEQGEEENREEKKEDEEDVAELEPQPQPEPEPELELEEEKAGHAQDEDDGDDSFEGVEMPEEDDEMEE
ncbi:unnamed protein product [Parascedosporium putredinis]|uniref:Guanylate kinase-like domain-containing protein n=1 Tax=Parascedosporium putredinis TaxID=1442378 RepID=A0A9P1GXQ5_9PEZI|nr:unnamed protein product [Parascedosporium putredinis]CAI7989275.1 unnamed protein product [Parascedosporium putredinis]